MFVISTKISLPPRSAIRSRRGSTTSKPPKARPTIIDARNRGRRLKSNKLPVYALKRVATMIAGAVERGDNEVLVLHFPAGFSWDGARRSGLNVRSGSGSGLSDNDCRPNSRSGAERDTRLRREVPIARSGRIGIAARAVHSALVMHYTLQYM